MDEKQTGYVLLFSGIIIMSFSLITVVLMFTNKIPPISLFNIPSPTLNTSSFIPNIQGLPTPKGQDITIIPTKDFNKILNLGISFILMGFIMSFGFKLADLGVKIIRPIRIESKT